MKNPLTRESWPPARLVLAGAVGVLLVLTLAPPFLSPGWRLAVMDGLAWFCHQIPERSFALRGTPLGLCHRCTGIMLGFLAGFVLPWRGLPGWRPTLLLAAALAPLAIDWTGDALGLWVNVPASRVLTGQWAGIVLAGLIVATLLAPAGQVARIPQSSAP